MIDDLSGQRLIVLIEQRFPFIGRVELQRVIRGIAHPERRLIRNGAFFQERERASEHAAAGVRRIARLDGQAAVLEGEAAGIFGHAVDLGLHAHRPAPLVILALVAESHRRSVGRVHGEGAVPGEDQRRAPGPVQGSAAAGVGDLVCPLQLNGEIPKMLIVRRAERLDFLQICAVERQLAQRRPRDLLPGQQLLERFIRDVAFAVIPVSVGNLAAVIPTLRVGHCAVTQHIGAVLPGDIDFFAVFIGDDDAQDRFLPPGIEGHIPCHRLGEVIDAYGVGIRVPVDEVDALYLWVVGPDGLLALLDDLDGIGPAQSPVSIGHGAAAIGNSARVAGVEGAARKDAPPIEDVR